MKEQQHAGAPLRRVHAVEGLGDFLYTLKAARRQTHGIRRPSVRPWRVAVSELDDFLTLTLTAR